MVSPLILRPGHLLEFATSSPGYRSQWVLGHIRSIQQTSMMNAYPAWSRRIQHPTEAGPTALSGLNLSRSGYSYFLSKELRSWDASLKLKFMVKLKKSISKRAGLGFTLGKVCTNLHIVVGLLYLAGNQRINFVSQKPHSWHDMSVQRIGTSDGESF